MKLIIRSKFTKSFAIIPNTLLRDTRLSFKARGIICMILSHSEEWSVNTGWLEEQGPDGRTSIRSGLEELKALGYARFDSLQGPDGRMIGTVWTFSDQPNLLKIDTENSVSEQSECQTIEKPHTSEETIVRSENHKRTETNAVVEIPQKLKTENFEDLWKEWQTYRKSRAKIKDFNSLWKHQLEFLARYDVDDAMEIIRTSMRNGWIGLFEPKTNGFGTPVRQEIDHSKGF